MADMYDLQTKTTEEYLTLYHLSTYRCAYYETCATYGLNVERVFQDGKFGFLNHPPSTVSHHTNGTVKLY